MKISSTTLLILVLLVVAILAGLNYYYQPFYRDEVPVVLQEKSVELEEEVLSRSEKILAELSSAQKIAQLIAFPVVVDNSSSLLNKESTSSAVLTWISDYNPGAIIIFGQSISKNTAKKIVKEITASYDDYPLRPIFAVDHEGGSVQRLSGQGFSKLPSWQQLCQLEQDERTELLGKSAIELSTVGISLVLAPVVDQAENNSILKTRACADIDSTMIAARDYIYSFARLGIMPVIKHFPGIGGVVSDLHQAEAEINLKESELSTFKDLLSEFPNIGVMTAHVKIADKFSGKPCSLSEECLVRFSQLFPDVLLVTDALEMVSARTIAGSEKLMSLAEVSHTAIIAGNNLLIFGDDVELAELNEIIQVLAKEYEDSELFREKVDQSLKKIIDLKKT